MRIHDGKRHLSKLAADTALLDARMLGFVQCMVIYPGERVMIAAGP
jgi:hypothetical protein